MKPPEKQRAHPQHESSPIDRLAQEIQRLNSAIQRVEQRLEQLENKQQDDLPKTLLRDIKETRDRVFKEAISSARERQEILKALLQLREQVGQSASFASRPRINIPEASQRVGIFVDVQNIFYAAKQFNARLDFDKLLKTAVGPRRLIRAIAYVVQSPDVDQSSFISMLQQKSYEVRRKDLRQRSDGSAKGDWDMGMAIDIMRFVDKLDVVVIVSGDGDFVSLINLVKTIGPRVEVISFLHNTAKDLINSADNHIPIEEGLLLKTTNGTPGSEIS